MITVPRITVSRRGIALAAGLLATAALTAGALLANAAGAADAAPAVGQPAPVFTAVDINGAAVSLSDYADRTVVLEWNNPECPYVMRHYESVGDIPALQAEATGDGVAWIVINSSAEGKQGYRDAPGMSEYLASVGAAPTRAILDHSGDLGRLYAAKATPSLYVVHEGVLVYQGAIDDKPTASPRQGVDDAHNYVRAALDALAAGAPIDPPQTVAYGCTVKYAG